MGHGSEIKVKKTYKYLFVAIFTVIIGNILVVLQLYISYQEKIDILAAVISSKEESNIDTVVGILGDGGKDVNEGKKILDSYGYLDYGQNPYETEFIRECIAAEVVSVILIGIIVLCIFRQNMILKAEQAKAFSQVEDNILKFRENWENVKLIDLGNENIEKINNQLEALQGHLSMLRKNASNEKEETKSFVTDISHQLKTPVAALDTCFSILEQDKLSESEKQEFMSRCRNSLDELEMLMQSLIQISRMEAGMIQLETKMEKLLPTMVEAVNRIYHNASQKDIDISFDYDKEIENIVILHDKKWLSEAFINILDNAIKYSSNNSEIKIEIQKRSVFISIEISDMGIGIPKSEYHKIFQRFYRGTLESVKNEAGSGVGLYLVREIIEKHHGTVTVNSNYGKTGSSNPGSTFVIQLPM